MGICFFHQGFPNTCRLLAYPALGKSKLRAFPVEWEPGAPWISRELGRGRGRGGKQSRPKWSWRLKRAANEGGSSGFFRRSRSFGNEFRGPTACPPPACPPPACPSPTPPRPARQMKGLPYRHPHRGPTSPIRRRPALPPPARYPCPALPSTTQLPIPSLGWPSSKSNFTSPTLTQRRLATRVPWFHPKSPNVARPSPRAARPF